MGYRGESGNTGKNTSLLNEFTNKSSFNIFERKLNNHLKMIEKKCIHYMGYF